MNPRSTLLTFGSLVLLMPLLTSPLRAATLTVDTTHAAGEITGGATDQPRVRMSNSATLTWTGGTITQTDAGLTFTQVGLDLGSGTDEGFLAASGGTLSTTETGAQNLIGIRLRNASSGTFGGTAVLTATESGAGSLNGFEPQETSALTISNTGASTLTESGAGSLRIANVIESGTLTVTGGNYTAIEDADIMAANGGAGSGGVNMFRGTDTATLNLTGGTFTGTEYGDQSINGVLLQGSGGDSATDTPSATIGAITLNIAEGDTTSSAGAGTHPDTDDAGEVNVIQLEEMASATVDGLLGTATEFGVGSARFASTTNDSVLQVVDATYTITENGDNELRVFQANVNSQISVSGGTYTTTENDAGTSTGIFANGDNVEVIVTGGTFNLDESGDGSARAIDARLDSEVTVLGGDFNLTEADGGNGTYFRVEDTASVLVDGGDFSMTEADGGDALAIDTLDSGTLFIRDFTVDADPFLLNAADSSLVTIRAVSVTFTDTSSNMATFTGGAGFLSSYYAPLAAALGVDFSGGVGASLTMASGSVFNLTGTNGSNGIAFGELDNVIFLIPEPGRAVLLIAGFAAVALRRRR